MSLHSNGRGWGHLVRTSLIRPLSPAIYAVIGSNRLVIDDPVKIGSSYLVIGTDRLVITNAVKIG